jgi:uncharacterized protein
MVTAVLVKMVIDQHALKGAHSIHFVDHWARVLENGRKLAPLTGARLDVVELFAVFHDAGRQSDGNDYNHGVRGAAVASLMHGQYYDLDQEGLDLLMLACKEHTDGKVEADVTVQTCWDADRLDLGRAGLVPAQKRLCTLAAKDASVIEWAHARSVQHFLPDLILTEWNLTRDRKGFFHKS